MNFENKTLQATLVGVIIVAVFIGYQSFQQTHQDNSQATSTNAVVATNCDDYDANSTSSEFTTDYQKVRNQAGISYHGEDKTGKDGTMAKVGLDLARLYHEYQAFQCSGSEGSFESQVFAAYRADGGMTGPVRGDSIVGDFTASEDATGQELASDLRRLGATNVAGPREGVRSNTVSAFIPIDTIPAVSQLKSLSHFTPAVAYTKSTGGSTVNNDYIATSTNTVSTTNCDAYNNGDSDSEFWPSYMPTFENRQALKQAMVSYHGEDMVGKDGPLASVGFDIALIYHEYQSYICRNDSVSDNFESETASVRGNSITIDAVAVDGGENLKQALKNLGAKSVSRYKHVVSASVPIKKIPQLANLSEVRSVSLSEPITNASSPGTTNQEPATYGQYNLNEIDTITYGRTNSVGFDFSVGSIVDATNNNADITYFNQCDTENDENDSARSCYIRVKINDGTSITRNTADCKKYEPELATTTLKKYGLDLSENDMVCIETVDRKTYKLKAMKKDNSEEFSLKWKEY
jgi:hypothetical protein